MAASVFLFVKEGVGNNPGVDSFATVVDRRAAPMFGRLMVCKASGLLGGRWMGRRGGHWHGRLWSWWRESHLCLDFRPSIFERHGSVEDELVGR